MSLLPNGDVIKFGSENRERLYNSNVGQGLVVRYSPDGERLWTRAFFDPDGQVSVNAATFDASGVLLVATGAVRKDETPTGWESRVVRLDDGGELVGPDTLFPGVVAELVRAGPDVLAHTYDLNEPLSSFLLERLEADGSSTVVLDAASLDVPDVGVTSSVRLASTMTGSARESWRSIPAMASRSGPGNAVKAT